MKYETQIQNIPDSDVHATTEELITSHLKVIPSFCKKYRQFSCYEDLVQACNLRLCMIAGRFDPSMGVTFYSFIAPYMEYTVKDEFRKHLGAGINRFTTKPLLKILQNAHKYMVNGALTKEAIERMTVELNVSTSDVDVYLIRYGTEMTDIDDMSNLVDSSIHPEMVIQNAVLESVIPMLPTLMKSLPEREYDILHSRLLLDEPETLKVLSERHGVSLERVRQLEQKTISFIKKMMHGSDMMFFAGAT